MIRSAVALAGVAAGLLVSHVVASTSVQGRGRGLQFTEPSPIDFNDPGSGASRTARSSANRRRSAVRNIWVKKLR